LLPPFKMRANRASTIFCFASWLMSALWNINNPWSTYWLPLGATMLLMILCPPP
jgi:hypothetical protein